MRTPYRVVARRLGIDTDQCFAPCSAPSASPSSPGRCKRIEKAQQSQNDEIGCDVIVVNDNCHGGSISSACSTISSISGSAMSMSGVLFMVELVCVLGAVSSGSIIPDRCPCCPHGAVCHFGRNKHVTDIPDQNKAHGALCLFLSLRIATISLSMSR